MPLKAALSLLLCGLCVAGCAGPGSTPPTFKIALVAPFAGHSRAIGYDAIYAARLAIRQVNQRGVAGYRLELIAFDDGGDSEIALQQAQLILLDPAVVGVIGHFQAETTAAAAGIYAAASLVWIDPMQLNPDPPPAQFATDYQTVSGGAPPGPQAWPTYQAVQMLIAAAQCASAHGALTPTAIKQCTPE